MSNIPHIPGYQILRQIGGGGFSAVYEALDCRSGKNVAIKFLFNKMANNEYVRNRFKKEATRYRDLKTKGIPELVDYIEENQCLVMEFVEGEDLYRHLKHHGCLDDKETLDYFSQILDIIGYLHKHHVLHLDIKPSNIMLTPQGEIKILDFGISATKAELDTIEKRVGSREYMAPEQVNEEQLGFYTDIYQTGVTLFKMVTGEFPFRGTDEAELYDNICNKNVPELREYDIKVNESLQSVIEKAMCKEPSQRYISCEEFKEDTIKVLMPNRGKKKQKNNIKKIEKMTKVITVGRDETCDKTIDDPYVGRRHLELIHDNTGAFFVRDLNSKNGTFVNGQRINGELQITPDDSIRIGNTNLSWPQYFDEPSDKGDIPLNGGSLPDKGTKRCEKWKKIFGGGGKWLLRTLSFLATSIIMMIIMMLFVFPKIQEMRNAKTAQQTQQTTVNY